MQAIANRINQALAGRAAAIRAAFAASFPAGLGSPLQTAATGANATYFLAVPAGLEGFVRCYPKDQKDLVLVTFVRARRAGAGAGPARTALRAVAEQAVRGRGVLRPAGAAGGVAGGRSYDALIVACAIRAGVERLLTLNRSDFEALVPEGIVVDCPVH